MDVESHERRVARPKLPAATGAGTRCRLRRVSWVRGCPESADFSQPLSIRNASGTPIGRRREPPVVTAALPAATANVAAYLDIYIGA